MIGIPRLKTWAIVLLIGIVIGYTMNKIVDYYFPEAPKITQHIKQKVKGSASASFENIQELVPLPQAKDPTKKERRKRKRKRKKKTN